MNRLDQTISGWNFKKIVRFYLITTTAAAIACIASTLYIFHDRISFAWQYQQLSETADKGDLSSLENTMKQMAQSDSNVVDIMILSSNNKVLFSANQSDYSSSNFDLKRLDNDGAYLITGKKDSTVFKNIKKDEFLLDSIFNTDYVEDGTDYANTYFYEENSSTTNVYLLNCFGQDSAGNKGYIILNPMKVTNGTMMLKIDATAAILALMIYWVMLALWVYHDAAKKKMVAVFWGFIVLLTNIVGLLVYYYYQHGSIVCPYCGNLQNRNNIYCTECGENIGKTCKNCGTVLSKNEHFCHHCGNKIE